MLDVCFWCGKDRCQESHYHEMMIYQATLRNDARRRLMRDGFLRTQADYARAALFAPTPAEQMTMADHWRKSFYQENVKAGMEPQEAMRQAKLLVVRMAHRQDNTWVRFSQQDIKTINERSKRWNTRMLSPQEKHELFILRQYGYGDEKRLE